MDLNSFVNAVAEMSSGTKTDSVLAKEAAMGQFKRRYAFAQKQTNYNNEELPAGSPIYVYCGSCGILIERLPEDYLFPPFSECSQCQGLKVKGWLNEACRSVLVPAKPMKETPARHLPPPF